MDIRPAVLRQMALLRSPYGYLKAGLPRFFSYFSRDALIAAWQMLRYDPGLCASTILFASRFQGAKEDWRSEESPGKIPHQVFVGVDEIPFFTRVFWGKRYYGSVDATPLWLILMAEMWRTECERARELIERLYPNALAALDWIRVRIRTGGFLSYRKRYVFGLTHQGWRDGYRNTLRLRPPVALADAQGYAYAALSAAAELSREVWHDPLFGEELETEAARLRERFNERFWLEGERTYAFALADGGREIVRRVTPEPAMVLFSGIIPDERVTDVADRMFRPDMWTLYGIRSLSTDDPLFRIDSYHHGSIWPWTNWMIWKGLLRYGLYEPAREIRDAMRRAWEFFGEFIPEVYGVTVRHPMRPIPVPRANLIQAWSLGALYDMVNA